MTASSMIPLIICVINLCVCYCKRLATPSGGKISILALKREINNNNKKKKKKGLYLRDECWWTALSESLNMGGQLV